MLFRFELPRVHERCERRAALPQDLVTLRLHEVVGPGFQLLRLALALPVLVQLHARAPLLALALAPRLLFSKHARLLRRGSRVAAHRHPGPDATDATAT